MSHSAFGRRVLPPESPYYDTRSTPIFIQPMATANGRTKLIKTEDRPSAGPPALFTPSVAATRLSQMSFVWDFTMFVIVQTTDTKNFADKVGAPKVITSRAKIDYRLNGSGTILAGATNNFPWEKSYAGDGVTGPNSWTYVTNGSAPKLDGTQFNAALRSAEWEEVP